MHFVKSFLPKNAIKSITNAHINRIGPPQTNKFASKGKCIITEDTHQLMLGMFLAPHEYFLMSPTFVHPNGAAGKFLTDGQLGWVGAASSVFPLVTIVVERSYTVMYPLRNEGVYL